MFTIISIMSQSSHDATPGLPPLKERLKDLLKIYIAYYRKLLLTPDSITELLENGIFKSDDIKHGAHNVAHIIISLAQLQRDVFFDPANCTSKIPREESKRFAQQLLHDLQAMTPNIDDLAKAMPEIKKEVWRLLEPETTTQRATTLQLQRDKFGAATLTYKTESIDPEDLLNELVTQCIHLRYDKKKDPTLRQAQLTECLERLRSLVDDMSTQRRDTFAKEFANPILRSKPQTLLPLYHAFYSILQVYNASGSDEDYERLITLASFYRSTIYTTIIGSVPLLPSQDIIVPLSPEERTRDIQVSTNTYGIEKKLLSEINTFLYAKKFDKARELEQYLVNPYIRAIADTYFIQYDQDPTGHRQERVRQYVIDEHDAPFLEQDFDDFVINKLNTGRIAFDETVRQRYIALAQQSIISDKVDFKAHGVLDALLKYNEKHPDAAIDLEPIRHAIWDRVHATTQMKSGINAASDMYLSQKNYLDFLKKCGDTDKVHSWIRYQYLDNPTRETAQLYLRFLPFDLQPFTTLLETTAEHDPRIPTKHWNSVFDNLRYISWALSR